MAHRAHKATLEAWRVVEKRDHVSFEIQRRISMKVLECFMYYFFLRIWGLKSPLGGCDPLFSCSFLASKAFWLLSPGEAEAPDVSRKPEDLLRDVGS